MNTFSEKQKFTQWWLWTLIIASLVVPLVLTFIKAGNAQVSLSVTDLLIGCSAPVLVIVLFLVIQLHTRIDNTGIYYKFTPAHFKTKKIEWNEIERAYIRTYSPIKEYGGWGIRKGLGKTGSAYNISGNIGLQVELKDGHKILFGTRKPEELASLLQSLMASKIVGNKTIKPPVS